MDHSSMFHRVTLASKIMQVFFIRLDLPHLVQKYQVYQRSIGKRVE